MYGCILFTGKTGQCSDIAPDEREAEPGAGLLGNVTCTFREVSKLWVGHHFCRLQGGMPSSIMLCQQRDVGSSLLPNSCANTAKPKWNVSEYSTTAGALEQAVQIRRPWWEVFEKIALVTFLRIRVERSCMPTRTRSKVCKASLLRAWIETLWVLT